VIDVRGDPPSFDRMPLCQAALAYAEEKHRGQRRQVDRAPFIEHPREVASLLESVGAPDRVIAAGALHDTLEKTDVTAAELSARFGPRVATLVSALTEDRRISGYAHRKAALREQVAAAGPEALLVFAADKLSKVRELCLAGPRRTPIRTRKVKHYQHCLELLEEHLPGSPLVAQLRTELASLPAPDRSVLVASG
jgi:guanosine-3',5'-bis(diphosphate) 3'-pyrophosphohydrolase